jgi:hypothetical protein
VGAAFELGHPSKQEVLLESVKTKITGYDRSKLIVRDLTHTREFLRGILDKTMPHGVLSIIMPARCLVLGRKKMRESPHGEAE